MTDERIDMPGRTKAVAEVPVEETEEARRKRLLRKAYSEATQLLRDKHRGDFEAFYSERAAAAGVEWQPRPNAEQKAAEEFDALVQQYPWLLDRVAGRDEDDNPEGDGSDEE